MHVQPAQAGAVKLLVVHFLLVRGPLKPTQLALIYDSRRAAAAVGEELVEVALFPDVLRLAVEGRSSSIKVVVRHRNFC